MGLVKTEVGQGFTPDRTDNMWKVVVSLMWASLEALLKLLFKSAG